MKNIDKILVGKPERKRPFRRVRRRWGDIIMDISEIGCEGVDWTHLARNRQVTASYEHGNKP
jgi:hypothetical protein